MTKPTSKNRSQLRAVPDSALHVVGGGVVGTIGIPGANLKYAARPGTLSIADEQITM